MKELEQFVDTLFARHRKTRETEELKSEILSNLEAKIHDFMQEGLEYRNAFALAIQHMDSIDFLIDDHRPIYVHRYRLDLIRWTLLYLLIVWILSIPLRVTYSGVWTNTVLTLAVTACTLLYIFHLRNQERPGRELTASIDTAKLARRKRAAWIIWGFYAFTISAWTTAVHFGSNVWFSRAVSIDGPYQMAVIFFDYFEPLLTVVIPLLFTKASSIIHQHEVAD